MSIHRQRAFPHPGSRAAANLTCAIALAAFVLAGCGGRHDPNARDVATFVLNRGGTVAVVDVQLKPKSVDQLPQRDFSISEILLQDPKVADSDLEQLKSLRQLRVLNLYQTAVGDRGLEHVGAITSLAELELSYTQVTDKGLEHLASLKRLQKLFLRGTAVTENAARELKKKLGDCKIYLDAEPL